MSGDNMLVFLYAYDIEFQKGAGTHRPKNIPDIDELCKRACVNMKDKMRNLDKRSIQKDKHTFHLVRTPMHILIVVTDPVAKLRIAFGLLEDVSDRVDSLNIGADVKGARATLRARLAEFNNPGSDVVAQCRVKLDEIKEVMVENLDKVFDNIANLEVLDEKAMELEDDALRFCKTTAEIKRMIQRRNASIVCVIVMVAFCCIFIIGIIIAIAIAA